MIISEFLFLHPQDVKIAFEATHSCIINPIKEYQNFPNDFKFKCDAFADPFLSKGCLKTIQKSLVKYRKIVLMSKRKSS